MNNDFKVNIEEFTEQNVIFDYWGVDHHLQKLEIPLLGEYQAIYAGMAVTAGLILGNTDRNISESAIRNGLLSTVWEGRFEIIGSNPRIVMDCAHNPESVKSLATALSDHLTYKRCIVILGIMQDKRIDELIEIIELFADHIILVKPHQKRSANPEILLKKLAKSQKVVEIVEEIPYALVTAHNISNPEDIICVTGSVFTVAEAKQSIENEGTI